jgi:hypothetical protein
MNKFKMIAASAALAMTMAGAGASQAATLVSEFTVDGASGGLGVAAPYGQVVVDDAGGTLAFTVSLFDGLKFRNTPDSNHYSFAFNLGGLAASVSNITDNGSGTFTFVGGPVNQSPFGTFQLAVDCTSGCTTGYNPNSPSVLGFKVTKAGGGALTIGNLTKNSNGDYFAADVTNTLGVTGNIGANSLKGAVPEPATWLIMLLGFSGLGAALRYRRQQGVAFARA